MFSPGFRTTIQDGNLIRAAPAQEEAQAETRSSFSCTVDVSVKAMEAHLASISDHSDASSSDIIVHVAYKHENLQESDLGLFHDTDETPPKKFIRKWPSLLMQLISTSNDDEWALARDRINTNPEEILTQGKNGGMSSLHAACIRYPPLHIIEAMLEVKPEAAFLINHKGECPLHLASYSASEDVQRALIEAAPESVSLVDIYGDSPLHHAARQGATYGLMERFVEASPKCISMTNARGVAPIWMLPRSFLEVEVHEDIFDYDAEDYIMDWNMMALFLKHSYKYHCGIDAPLVSPESQQEYTPQELVEKYSWVVHAAAATPAFPTEVLRFLCRMYPDAALNRNTHGMTPLLLACQSEEIKEPKEWNETEDGFREHLEVSVGDVHNSDHEVSGSETRLNDIGDSAFIALATSKESSMDDAPDCTLSVLLEWSPRSALVPDQSGRLPLNVAISSGRSWNVVRQLLAAYPRSLINQDRHGFSMFHHAAMFSPELTTVYSLLRSLPEALSGRQRQQDNPVSLEERSRKRQRTGDYL